MTAEKGYRPTTLDELSGQDRAKKMLKIYIKAAQIKNECLDHVLISGPSGCGKTTLANIIAHEMGKEAKVYSCPAIKTVQDLTDILCNIQEGEIIFFDEIHSLKTKVQEALYFTLEQFVVDVNLDGESIRQPVPHFTLIGATTSLGGLELPCRNRFPIQVELNNYDSDSMMNIVKCAYKAMKVAISDRCARMIGDASRSTPRIANSYVRRVYDFALVMNDGEITEDVVLDSFEILGINKYGMNQMDMAYLRYLADARKAVGVDTLATALGTDRKSLEEVTEPYLISLGVVSKGARGRTITQKGLDIVKEF